MERKRLIEKRVLKKSIKHKLNQFLLMVLFFLLGMISVKISPNMKSVIRENFFEKSFSFLKIRKIYDKYFNVSDFNNSDEVQSVFHEKLSFLEEKKIDGGVQLRVTDQTNIPMFKDGLIVFSGVKDDVNTVVVDLVDGVSVVYQNVFLKNYSLYDYVEEGEILGQVDGNYLNLFFEKEGEEIDYKEYI